MIVKDMSAEDRAKFDAELTFMTDDEDTQKARERQIERERKARQAL